MAVYQFIIGLALAVIQDLSEINSQLDDFDVTSHPSKSNQTRFYYGFIRLSSDYYRNFKHDTLGSIVDLVVKTKLLFGTKIK